MGDWDRLDMCFIFFDVSGWEFSKMAHEMHQESTLEAVFSALQTNVCTRIPALTSLKDRLRCSGRSG